MLKERIEKAFNEQINAETYSAYLYWSMSAALEDMGLKGFANWMRVQAQEEMTHAAKFFGYIVERGGRVKLTAIAAPPAEWKDLQAIFEETLKHEQHVTSLINGLVDLSIEARDHASGSFLQWFVTEQVEEEATAQEILGMVKLASGSPGSLFMLDKEMGQRVFTAPTSQGETE